MAVTHAVRNGNRLPANANVTTEPDRYLIRFDVADFTPDELSIEAVGRHLTVLGDQYETVDDHDRPFRMHERLEEWFSLPDDADVERLRATYRHGTLEVCAPRRRVGPRRIQIEDTALTINAEAAAC
jgi:HSP20 family protein